MATDKFKGFIEQAAQNPDILAQVGELVKGFNQKDDGKKDDLLSGVMDIAEKFGIDLTPDDIETAPKADATDATDDGFGLDDLGDLAGSLLGSSTNKKSSKDDGFGLDDLGDLAGSLLGDASGDKGGDNPLESLLALFKQFTAK
ncbi:MAG: hypothetical protein GX562_06495 [Coriobacteriaceae bacterium]|nr:hypothetical protein [Coriobacteriaceae bacterium]